MGLGVCVRRGAGARGAAKRTWGTRICRRLDQALEADEGRELVEGSWFDTGLAQQPGRVASQVDD